jgi:hypothetical protein
MDWSGYFNTLIAIGHEPPNPAGLERVRRYCFQFLKSPNLPTSRSRPGKSRKGVQIVKTDRPDTELVLQEIARVWLKRQ